MPNRQDRLIALTDQIVESYYKISTINHLGQCHLPGVSEVLHITEDLKEILFPGYRKRQDLHLGNVMYHIGDLLDSIYNRLTIQISRALRYQDQKANREPCAETTREAYERQAAEITVDFLESLPKLREVLSKDVQAAFDGDPAARHADEVIFCYPGFEAITVHRLAHELYKRNVPLIPRMMSESSHSKTGIDIHPGARIGHSFFIDHGTGVVIGETCEIHAYVKVYQGVTLGALSFPKDSEGNIIKGIKRHPTIGEGVVIYANATILGGDTVIGDHSVIGASVSLSKSIPPNTVVTIEKPQLKFREANSTVA
jgi:serine O-acetyltransferase